MFDRDWLLNVGDKSWLDEDSGYYFTKDESGQWWVEIGAYKPERGPFNSLEHALDCAQCIYEKEGVWE